MCNKMPVRQILHNLCVLSYIIIIVDKIKLHQYVWKQVHVLGMTLHVGCGAALSINYSLFIAERECW